MTDERDHFREHMAQAAAGREHDAARRAAEQVEIEGGLRAALVEQDAQIARMDAALVEARQETAAIEEQLVEVAMAHTKTRADLAAAVAALTEIRRWAVSSTYDPDSTNMLWSDAVIKRIDVAAAASSTTPQTEAETQ